MPTIHPVSSSRDLKNFIRLPWSVYPGDPHWVPPLLSEEAKLVDRERNPFYRHAEAEFFLARDASGRAVGRIGAIENRSHNELHRDKVGFWGFLEAVDDPEVVRALLDRAGAWLKDRGLMAARGPCNPSMNDTCGMLVDGFDGSPRFLMPYNRPYLPKHVEAAGHTKAMDLLAWFSETETAFRSPLARIGERLRGRVKAWIRPVNLKRFDEELAVIRRIYNAAWGANWGFVPMTEEEFAFTAKDFRMLIGLAPEMSFIMELKGEPVAFGCGVPDINVALKPINGRLFPWGWAYFLWKARRIRVQRTITLGVLPEHQRAGLGVLLTWEFVRRAKEHGWYGGEMSWLLETNTAMARPLEMMGGKPYRRYRIYEKELA